MPQKGSLMLKGKNGCKPAQKIAKHRSFLGTYMAQPTCLKWSCAILNRQVAPSIPFILPLPSMAQVQKSSHLLWGWSIYYSNFPIGLPGVWMGFKGHRWRNSFSRYCNEIVKVFSIYFCQNMLKNEISIISIHKILSTISFKTFSGSFSRYCNEFVRRFDCDLRDIDGATHF